MSLIFDALQRSEAERSGTKLPASAATEVLRLAELRVAAERQSAAQSVPESTAHSVEHDKIVAVEELPAPAAIGVDGSIVNPISGTGKATGCLPPLRIPKMHNSP